MSALVGSAAADAVLQKMEKVWDLLKMADALSELELLSRITAADCTGLSDAAPSEDTSRSRPKVACLSIGPTTLITPQ